MKKIILAIVFIFSIMLIPRLASAQLVEAVVLEGKTDSSGRFTIKHQYLAEPECERLFIVGAIVSIRSPGNKEWYTMADRNEEWQAISYRDKVITGYFNVPGFENQPVRVVLFLTPYVC